MFATLTRPRVVPGPLPGQLPRNPVYLRHFHGEQQLQEEWCWAAAAVCIANTYAAADGSRRRWQQHGLADAMFHRCDCAVNPICDQQARLDDTLKMTGHFRCTIGDATFAEIRHEIDHDRPLGVRIMRRNGDEHFVIIYGYGDNLGLAVFDPGLQPGAGYLATTLGRFAFSIGDWQNTDLTK